MVPTHESRRANKVTREENIRKHQWTISQFTSKSWNFVVADVGVAPFASQCEFCARPSWFCKRANDALEGIYMHIACIKFWFWLNSLCEGGGMNARKWKCFPDLHIVWFRKRICICVEWVSVLHVGVVKFECIKCSHHTYGVGRQCQCQKLSVGSPYKIGSIRSGSWVVLSVSNLLAIYIKFRTLNPMIPFSQPTRSVCVSISCIVPAKPISWLILNSDIYSWLSFSFNCGLFPNA